MEAETHARGGVAMRLDTYVLFGTMYYTYTYTSLFLCTCIYTSTYSLIVCRIINDSHNLVSSRPVQNNMII